MLTLYYHPFASFCQKVLIALYENAVPFRPHLVDLGDPEARAAFLAIWPIGKFPVLHDAAPTGWCRNRAASSSTWRCTIRGRWRSCRGPGRGAAGPPRRPLLRQLRARADAEDRHRHPAPARPRRPARGGGCARAARHRLRNDRGRDGRADLGGGRGLHHGRLCRGAGALLRQLGAPVADHPGSPPISPASGPARPSSARWRRPGPTATSSRRNAWPEGPLSPGGRGDYILRRGQARGHR